MNRGCGPILPGCGEIVGFLRGATPATPLIGRGRACGVPRAMGLGLEKRCIESNLQIVLFSE